jgi:outer membrane lipoprotein carrier protein
MRIIVLLSCLLFSQFVMANEVEDRVNRALTTLDNLKADFKQTVLDDNKKVVQQSSGTVSISRPGKFAWIYKQPYEQQIIADGKELWVYDVDLDQATVKPMESGLATAPIMVLMNNQKVETQFDVSELGQRKYLYWVELTPKKSDMEFSTVYIGLENDVIKAMELRDPFGQSTQIVFENLQTNMIFDPKTFKFEAPPGVDVFGAGS